MTWFLGQCLEREKVANKKQGVLEEAWEWPIRVAMKCENLCITCQYSSKNIYHVKSTKHASGHNGLANWLHDSDSLCHWTSLSCNNSGKHGDYSWAQ